MERRTFTKLSMLATLGGLILPSGFLSSCRKEELLEDVTFDGKVIIIGAGAAGLYTGYMLHSRGIDFTILEASAVHGGRLGKVTGFADYAIDTGAQWMHGNNSIIADLVRLNNIAHIFDDSDLNYWFNNQLTGSLPKDPFIFEADDMPDISFKDYAHQKGFGAEYDNIIEAIAGDQGASASLLSAYWNSKDEENWVSGIEDYKFAGTYFDVIDQLIAAPVASNIQYNTPVKAIDYSGDKIVVTDVAMNTYTADKVVVTVPISILKLAEIDFYPALPEEKTVAFQKFGMGPGMKVFLKFSTKFFDGELYGGPICAAYVDDSVGKTTSDNVMMAFVMGDQAVALHALGSDAAITNALLQELDVIYNGQATPAFLSSQVLDYTDKPFIKGAYSYSTIGMGDARKVAAQSLNNKVFFAGEAMNTNGHHQTVHGAVESGYKAVIDILTGLK